MKNPGVEKIKLDYGYEKGTKDKLTNDFKRTVRFKKNKH